MTEDTDGMEGAAEQVLTAALDNEAIAAYMRHDVVVLAALLRDGMASRALLDALDAVPRRHLVEAGNERDQERARAERAERAETALRDLVYAKVSPTNAECPHCSSQSCYTGDPDDPVGVLRCSTTGLAVIASWAQGDTHWPLWHRARAVLEGRG